MLLTEAIARYVHAMALEGRSPCTIRNARCALRELAAFMLGMSIGDIREITQEAFLGYRARLAQRPTARGTPLCVASQCEHLGSLRSFCRWMVAQDWLAADPMQRVPQPRRRRQLPRAILEPEEVALLCSLPDMHTPAGYRDRVILEILYSSALRRAEVANLGLDDLDTRRGYLFVRQGKNGKDRVVPVGSGVCELINRYVAEVRPGWPRFNGCARLFLNRFGGGMHPIAVWHIVRKYVRRAGIDKPISTHSFRHSCATHMVRAGASIRHLQELLGHASIETTQIYTQLTINDLKDAHRRFHPRERDIPDTVQLRAYGPRRNTGLPMVVRVCSSSVSTPQNVPSGPSVSARVTGSSCTNGSAVMVNSCDGSPFCR